MLHISFRHRLSHQACKIQNLLRSTHHLAYEIFGPAVSSSSACNSSVPSVVFLHGMLGSKRNFRTPANAFLKRFPEYRCITVDIRGHGDSNGSAFQEPHTIAACVKDLRQLMAYIGIDSPRLIVAHSFSGKVAMEYAVCSKIDKYTLPSDIWILDTIPIQFDLENDRRNSNQSVSRVIEIVSSFPETFESRDWMIAELLKVGVAKSIAQWLGTSVVDTGHGCRWKFDKNIIKDLFKDYCGRNYLSLLKEYDDTARIHIVRAGRVTSWTPELIEELKGISSTRPDKFKFHTMPNVGHWIHAEDQQGLLDLIADHSSCFIPPR